MRSPSAVLHLLADDHRQPGRRRVARRQRAIDPVVVGDDEVRQPASGRCTNDVRRVRHRQSNDADV